MEQAQLTRPQALAEVRKALGQHFPKATFTTNDDANPATPMSVTASWANGKIIKVVRADSIRATVPEFIAKAVSVLSPFQDNAVPSRHLQQG